MRAAVIDFDLQSRLWFDMNGAEARLHYVAKGSGGRTALATIKRPGKGNFEQQLELVAAYADLREDRAGEILAQMTPAAAFWASVLPLQPDRSRNTFEVVDCVLRLANYVEMRFKHALACLRPHELSPQIQPMIQTPGHGSYPSGHATESFAVAYVLSSLVPPQTTAGMQCAQLARQAARIAVNRTVAGLHFPVDSAAGAFLGLLVGQFFVACCTSTGTLTVMGRAFDGTAFAPAGDFDYTYLYDATKGPANAPFPNTGGYVTNLANVAVDGPSEALKWLWTEAGNEWS